ncbi:peptidoglycan DD-metalloendopeptidase family protein [Curtobacterium sp. RRHDQ10]|uniref:M23 family metallopeptidase n=1 Tax=Curtobacterium phyllosphaerae TaxID=3413379 RepID=UPI003BF41A5E
MPFDVTDSPAAPHPVLADPASSAPGTAHGTVGFADAAPMTRRERIAAERLAAGLAPRPDRAVQPAVVAGVPVSPDVVVPAAARPVFADAAPVSPDVVAILPVAAPESAAAPESVAPPGSPAAPESVAAPESPATPESVAAPAVDRRAAGTAVRRATVAPSPSASARRGSASRRGAAFRRTASGVTGAVVLAVVAGMVVGTSVPAQAFYTPTQIQGLRDVSSAKAQSLEVGAGGVTSATDAGRDTYSVTEAAAKPQNTANTFTNNPDGTIQWPFPTGVPISSGFGARNVEGCSFCSTFHQGVDFAPGAGTPIHSVAAGVVTKVKADDGGYGNDVWVEHDVDGKQFVSVYGHMKDNSFTVVEGQEIAVGAELGEVGSTGNSTGPHLHLEIHVNGVPVDPIAWLTANAN